MDAIEEMIGPGRIGHNSPPSDAEELRDRLADSARDLIERANALIEAAKRIPDPITDEDTARRCASFVKQVGIHAKVVDDRRASEKRPYDELGKVVQAMFTPIIGQLEAAKRAANQRMDAFLKASQATSEAPAQIRSDLGAVASLRRTLAYEVVDAKKVPRKFLTLNVAAVKAHMATAPKGELPAEVPGLRFFFNEQMVTR